MRRFGLHRHVDRSGVSGVGIIAEGVEFSDGSVAVRWLSEWPSTVLHENIKAVEAVHGHGGETEIIWVD